MYQTNPEKATIDPCTDACVIFCACGCGEKLTGKASTWKNDAHKNDWYTEARRRAARALGKTYPQIQEQMLCPPVEIVRPRGHAHVGAVIGNPRLEPLLMAMMGKKIMTSIELQKITGAMSIGTDMSNIRKFYPALSRAKYIGKTETGRKIYQYRWEGK